MIVPRVVAHRGGSGYRPENTLAAFVRSMEAGTAGAIEFDVQRTSDGSLVVFHDTDLRRTSDVADVYPFRATDPLSGFTFAELSDLDVGSWFSPRPCPGERIPSLDNVVDILRARIGLVLELKHPSHYPGIVNQVLDTLRRHGLHAVDDVTICSFELDSLEQIGSSWPGLHVLPLVRSRQWDPAHARRLSTEVSVAPDLSPEDITAARTCGLQISVGTVNSTENMLRALSEDHAAVVTDFPDDLARIICGATRHICPSPLQVKDVHSSPVASGQPDTRTVSLQNTSPTPLSADGWYVFDDVRTDLPSHPIPAGGTIDMRLCQPQGQNASSARTLTLRDPADQIQGVVEYRAR